MERTRQASIYIHINIDGMGMVDVVVQRSLRPGRRRERTTGRKYMMYAVVICYSMLAGIEMRKIGKRR